MSRLNTRELRENIHIYLAWHGVQGLTGLCKALVLFAGAGELDSARRFYHFILSVLPVLPRRQEALRGLRGLALRVASICFLFAFYGHCIRGLAEVFDVKRGEETFFASSVFVDIFLLLRYNINIMSMMMLSAVIVWQSNFDFWDSGSSVLIFYTLLCTIFMLSLSFWPWRYYLAVFSFKNKEIVRNSSERSLTLFLWRHKRVYNFCGGHSGRQNYGCTMDWFLFIYLE